ncbi:uncharacterized protein K02A2.6-like [Amphibalanus amphitrite]|uniref:uncharacterized protein K02A2.6-like n=1 Tax=Amphibalanus amphitrite TaxID=1232801 RepID=UPI001C9128BC|nr:uncharacterized protein K02A2.6-like [Amphibalanus amphitrite]
MAAPMLPGVDRFVMGGDFDRWLTSVDLYLDALDVTSEARKRAMLLHLIGPDLQQVFGTLPEPVGVEGAYEISKAKLRAYLTPARNTIAEKLAFSTIRMEAGEKFEAYLARLRVAANRCGFTGQSVDQEVRNQCLAGTKGKLQERLLQRAAERGDQLTLQDVVAAATAMERTEALIEQMRGPSSAAEPGQLVAGAAGPAAEPVQLVAERQLTCYRCGQPGHRRAECQQQPKQQQQRTPTKRQGRGPVCYKCRQPGHLKKNCKSKVVPVPVQEVSQSETELWCVQQGQGSEASHMAPLKMTLQVNDTDMEFVVDTGSPVTIIGSDSSVPGLCLQRSDLVLSSFTGHAIPVKGEAVVKVQRGTKQKNLRLVVVDFPKPVNLLGREWMAALGLTPHGVLQLKREQQLEDVLARHQEVFSEELGRVPIKISLKLKEGAKPVYRKARTVPFALQPLVDRELDRWVEEGIAERVEAGVYSGWGTPLVPIPKQDGVRLCADYRITVNPQLEPVRHPLRTPEELFACIKGKRFAKLDCKCAYQQCELTEESKDMTTVTTQRGAYRMNRLPYGIATCGALFQSVIDQVTDGLEGVVCYLDDLLVTADSEEQLVERLDKVLERLKANGVRLKREKCVFNAEKVTYLGWEVSATELKALEDKTRAVKEAPEPTNVDQLRSFIGSVSYYQRMLPDLATVLAPLYALLKKGVSWRWTAACSAAVSRVKRMLSSPPVLMRYDVSLPLKLVTDASATGLGAALVHVTPDGLERPVSYASRTLTPTERKYAQVEKEAAGVSFGIRRFHQFLFGRPFTLVVDNRALSRILSPDRELPSLAAARMQRYALQLAAYQYRVELRRTEEMRVADTLSRLPVRSRVDEQAATQEEADSNGHSVLFMTENGPALTARDVAAATRRDPVLARVLAAVRSGWDAVVDPDLVPYKTRQEELSTDADCVLWGGRIVIPRALRTQVKNELHEGHFGCARMKQLARRFVWWPGLDAELEAAARDCAACAAKRAEPPHAIRHPWEPAGGPWERVHVDFAGPLLGYSYLVIVDSYSKWLEVLAMKSTTAERTVAALRTVFARLGLPVQLVSDNGPQFACEEFAAFMTANGIRHTRVAPYHPSSNGLAERAVGTLKNGLKAAAEAGVSPERALARFLIAYRSTPHAVTGRTPAEMIYGRNLRTRFNLLVPCADATLRAARVEQQLAAGGRAREFRLGAAVWARAYGGRQKWTRGTVVARPGPVSYEVDIGGAVWSRHADQLLAADGHPAAPGNDGSKRPPSGASPEAGGDSGGGGGSGVTRRAGLAPPHERQWADGGQTARAAVSRDGASSPVGDGAAAAGSSSPVGDGAAAAGSSSPVGDGAAAAGSSSPVGDGAAAAGSSSPVGDGAAAAGSSSAASVGAASSSSAHTGEACAARDGGSGMPTGASSVEGGGAGEVTGSGGVARDGAANETARRLSNRQRKPTRRLIAEV